MTQQPYISVLIPVYNAERYLEESVCSVLKQDFSDYEILLLDDGSTDNSGAICDRLQKQYPEKIHVQHQKNTGPLIARRHLYNMANGAYIMLIDADDRLAEGALHQIVAVLRRYCLDMVLYNYQRIDEKGIVLPNSEFMLPFDQGFLSSDDILSYMAGDESINSLWVKCIRADVFRDLPSCETYDVRNGEDLLESILLLSRIKTLYYISEVLYEYRVNTVGLSWQFRDSQVLYVTLIRPLLLQKLQERQLCTAMVLQKYYILYLQRVWYILHMVVASDYSATNVREVMERLLACPVVVTSKEYLSESGFSLTIRLIFQLFFRHRLYASVFLIRLWHFVQRTFGR